jgi:5-methylcytosine-specific restriction endonuclease McrA
MSLIYKPVLLLNSSFEPLSIISTKRALKLMTKGVAKAEESGDIVIYSHRMWDENNGDYVWINVYNPSVVRLLEYRKIPIRIHVLTKKNIHNRDRSICQYCYQKFPHSKLTLDHVIPRSRGGKDSWQNLVSACTKCNRKKGDRLLSEIKDMVLLHEPRPMTVHTSRYILRNLGADDPKWRKYLYYDDDK